MATDRDKPRPANLSFKELDAEERPEPFIYRTDTGHRVVFPDIFEMEAEEGEKFLNEIQRQQGNNYTALKKWLSKDDYDALRADKLTMRQLMRLAKTVYQYYEGSLGDLGEGLGSGN